MDESMRTPMADRASTDLIRYANGLLLLDSERLGEEYGRVQKRLTESNDPSDRMRLAILLLDPNASFRDLEKARAVLEDFLTDPGTYDDSSDYRALALFLLSFTDSVKQAGASEGKLKRELESERLRRESLARRLESMDLELAAVRAERRILQSQVEALKNIEETLRTRNLSGDERPRP